MREDKRGSPRYRYGARGGMRHESTNFVGGCRGIEGTTLVARLFSTPQSQPQVEDGFLIALAKQGNADACHRLVRRYYGFVRLDLLLPGWRRQRGPDPGGAGWALQGDSRLSLRSRVELPQLRRALHHPPIITAVKTATRNKHTPLNQYVSFSSTPAGDAGANDSTLDVPGPSVHDPVNQVVGFKELRALVACLSTALSELESQCWRSTWTVTPTRRSAAGSGATARPWTTHAARKAQGRSASGQAQPGGVAGRGWRWAGSRRAAPTSQ